MCLRFSKKMFAKMNILFVFMLFFVFFARGSYTPIAPCISAVPPPQHFKLGDCQKWPCELKRGTFVSSQIVFEAHEDINEISHQVTLTYQGHTMPILYPDTNACKHLDNATCPIFEKKLVSLSFETYIYSSFREGEVLETKVSINSLEGGIVCCRGKAIIV